MSTATALRTPVRRGTTTSGKSSSIRIVEREVPVPQKSVATVEYNAAVKKFIDRLTNDQVRGIVVRKDARIASVSAHQVIGRKFDRIFVNTTFRDTNSAVSETRYFINRATGEIFGAKSRLAPNLNHYFGLVQNAHKWDWSARYGINKNDDTVQKVGAYAQFTHYAPKSKFQR